eukprot:TRINITY_DN16193_c0_g1_i1.p1 TRINITY_DN16193_c0_g1~~TRINITY_DN16193_c0_g1_i1.p1  ORF type:complete len:122 (+),score=19.27 TRINITY_DN16193_c0_g1_i1:164-529(+)
MAKSPESGFSSPFGEGLVFISHDEPKIEDTTKFNDWNKKDFANYFQDKKRQGQPISLNDPAAYLQLIKGWCVIYKLTKPRSGKYIHIKLLRPRQSGTTIDIQYIGFKGWDGSQTFSCGQLA